MTGIATFDCCDAVRATAGCMPICEFVDARPTAVVGARPTTGCDPVCVGVRPTNGESRFECDVARVTEGMPVCDDVRATSGSDPVCVGVRPITGIATFDCCDAVRATTGCMPITVCEFVGARPTAGSMFDFVDARPTTGCMPITVCERPTGDDVRASTGCDVAARGNGGGTDAARGSAGGVVPIGVRRGIGGGCDVRIAGDDVCVWGWGSTAVCSSFVAIATARDAPGEPELPQSIRGLGCRLSRETG